MPSNTAAGGRLSSLPKTQATAGVGEARKAAPACSHAGALPGPPPAMPPAPLEGAPRLRPSVSDAERLSKSMALAPDQVVLGRLLGSGSQGRVYEGWWKGRHVAVKVGAGARAGSCSRVSLLPMPVLA